MPKTYFVDSENIGDSWIDILQENPESNFLIFYTGHSPRINYEHAIILVNAKKKPQFIQCHEGNNALDFQLVSYLGYQLHSQTSEEMIIVSNDTGFDAVVHFWTERNMNISRLATNDIHNTDIETENLPVSEDEIANHLSVKLDKKVSGIDIKELYTIINCIGKKESSYVHLAYIHFYGNKKGESIYKYMKQGGFSAPSVQWKKDIKFKKFCELIFKYCNTSAISIPPDFITYLYSSLTANDDKKTMSKKLEKQYTNHGTQLNKILKPFYKILITIKK